MEYHYQIVKSKVTIISNTSPEETKRNLKNIYDIDSSGIVYTSAEGKSRRVSLSHMKNIIVNGNHNVGIDDLKDIIWSLETRW